MRSKRLVILLVVLIGVGLVTAIYLLKNRPGSVAKKEGLKLKPTVEMASMNITDIDPDKVKLVSKVVLSNPLPLGLSTSKLNYEIFIDSIKLIKSSYDKPIHIKSNDSTVIEMPMAILTKPLNAVADHFKKTRQDSANYTVKAHFDVDVPIAGERTFTVNMTKRLPAILIPKMEPGKIDIDKLGLHESKVEMVLHVTNPNTFPIKMKDGRYTVVIDKNMKMQGSMEKIVSIPARGSDDIAMALDIKTSNLPKLGWKMLFEKKDTDFSMDFKCKLLTESDILKNSNMAFTAKGNLEELKKMAENVAGK